MRRSRTFVTFLGVGLLAALTFAIAARSWDDDDNNPELKLLGAITIPATSPLVSTDIVSVDQITGKLFFSDRSNLGVDVFNVKTDLFLGRITKNAAGSLHFAGVTSPSTHQGPNGVVATNDLKVWAGDGDTTVKVADVDPTSPTYLQIVASINTAMQSSVSNCTGGATGSCNRDDEMAYDPENNILVVATDEPTSIQPFLSFISTVAPYPILGQMNFAAQGLVATGGLEQPVWDPEIHRFLQTLPVTNSSGTGSIAIVNPFTHTVDKTISVAGFNCEPTGEALGPHQHVLVACTIPGAAAPSRSSFPLVIDLTTGNEVGPGITQVGGGDEVNYDPGNNRFIVSSYVGGVTTNPTVLGVINAETGEWLANLPSAAAPVAPATIGTGGLATSGKTGNLAAYGKNNHVFVIVKPATPTPAATDICGTTGGVDYGCLAVFGPTRSSSANRDNNNYGRNDDRGRSW